MLTTKLISDYRIPETPIQMYLLILDLQLVKQIYFS